MANKRTAEQLKNQSGWTRDTPVTGRSETSSNSSVSDSQGTGTPRNQVDFQFLNFSHPSDAKATNARKAVRSHVTKQQHQKEQKLQQERRAKSFQGTASEGDQRPTPQRPHAETFPRERPTTIELSGPSSAAPSLASSPDALSAPTSRSPTASPTYPPERQIDLSECYPESWQPHVQHVLDSYRSDMATVVPELELSEARQRYCAFVTTDPALLHAVMLVASWRHLATHATRAHPIDLLQLRGMAIREVNRALESQVRNKSDQLIAAVAHLAWYEVLCGDRNSFHTHMAGLLSVVRLRGGLPGLGLGGVLERILLWIDANAVALVGAGVYFDRAAFPTSAEHPKPDPRGFARGTA